MASARRDEQVDSIIDSIPAFVAMLTATGGVEYINRQLLDYSGKSIEELEKWGTSDLLHPDDLSGAIESFTQGIRSGEPFEIVHRMRRRDGVYRWFQGRHRPLKDLEGRVVRWCVSVTDIDGLKRAEERLRRDEAFLAEVQQLSSTGGFYWWPESGEVYWSEQVYRIFELDPAAPLTTALRQSRIHPDDLPAHQESIQRAIRDARYFEYEVRLLMPDNSVKYVHSLARPSRDAEGKLVYVGAVQDITQRRLSEIALAKVRSELAQIARVTTLGALTASIAHEVNQPLSGIITNASTCLLMLNADPPNIDGARETAKRTIRDGNRASDVITRLRALFSKKELTLESLDLNEATREVVALFLSDLQRNGVMLHAELAENLPTVKGDRVEVQQVILNLLRNASEAMTDVHDRQRVVLVETARDGGNVRVTVRDAGVGLDRQSVEKVFDPFYTTKSGGMGIGLSVSRSIIESHQGRIFAIPNDGPGATFAFTIPAEPTQQMKTPSQASCPHDGYQAPLPPLTPGPDRVGIRSR